MDEDLKMYLVALKPLEDRRSALQVKVTSANRTIGHLRESDPRNPTIAKIEQGREKLLQAISNATKEVERIQKLAPVHNCS